MSISPSSSKKPSDDAIGDLNQPKKSKYDTNFVDLNGKCLEKLFEYLDLDDLISVAETNTKFYQPACDVFSRKYANTKHEIYGHFAREFLRNFGHLATNLEIPSASSYIVAEYYAKMKVKQPFRNLTKLKFVGVELDERVTNFAVWFPNLISLSLKLIELYDTKCIEVKLPALRRLEISNNVYDAFQFSDSEYISCKNIRRMLTLNPHLEHLSLNHDYEPGGIKIDAKMLRFINEKLENLESLNINLINIERSSGKPSEWIVFENLKKFKIDVHEMLILESVPVKFGKLDELTIISRNGLTGEFFDFAVENVHLTKLTVKSYSLHYKKKDRALITKFMELIDRLKELREISYQISFTEFVESNFIEFLQTVRPLQRMRVQCCNQSDDPVDIANKFQLKLNEFENSIFNQSWTLTVKKSFRRMRDEVAEEDRPLIGADVIFERKS